MRPGRWSVLAALCAACGSGSDGGALPAPSSTAPPASTGGAPSHGAGGDPAPPAAPVADAGTGGAASADASATPPAVTPAGSGVIIACGVTQGSGRTCTGVDDFVTCVRSRCGTELTRCFGADDAAAQFAGSVCAEYATCATFAPDPCGAACTKSLACDACLTTAAACIQGSGCPVPFCTGGEITPEPEPEPGDGGGAGVPIAGTCGELEACCASLEGSGRSACTRTLADARARGGDADCAVVLTTYRVAGVCKAG